MGLCYLIPNSSAAIFWKQRLTPSLVLAETAYVNIPFVWKKQFRDVISSQQFQVYLCDVMSWQQFQVYLCDVMSSQQSSFFQWCHELKTVSSLIVWRHELTQVSRLLCFILHCGSSTVGAGKPETFGFPMVALCSVFQWLSVFQWHSVLTKMVASFKTNENSNKIATMLFKFPMVQFWNGQVIDVAMIDHSKT